MEKLPNSRLLKFLPDSMEAVRNEFNADTQMIMDSVDLLEDWLLKQTHFVRKSYHRDFLDKILSTCKGSIERTKARIDKMCTFKTLMPEFFQFLDAKNELDMMKEYISIGFSPILMSDHIRIFMLRVEKDIFKTSDLVKFYKFLIMTCEYMNRFEYCCGFRIIVDCTKVNILNIVTSVNPMDLKKMMTILIEGYGMRVKGISIISDSKLIESLLSLIKQVVSAKIAKRIHVHKYLEDLHKIFPKELLPEDYGGTERPLRTIFDDWCAELTSDEHIAYAHEMSKATTIESSRSHSNFNENYMGTPGSFRLMKID